MTDSVLQVNQIKDKGGNATGITVADSTANVTINNLAAGTIGSGVTFPSGKVTNVFNYWTTGTEYSNQSTTLKAMQTSNSISCISGRKYYIITTFNAWNYKDSSNVDNNLSDFHLYTGTTSRTQGTTTFTNDTDQGRVRIGKYFVSTTATMNTYRSVALQGSFTASSTTTYYYTIVGKSHNSHSVTRMQGSDNHPWKTIIFEVQP